MSSKNAIAKHKNTNIRRQLKVLWFVFEEGERDDRIETIHPLAVRIALSIMAACLQQIDAYNQYVPKIQIFKHKSTSKSNMFENTEYKNTETKTHTHK